MSSAECNAGVGIPNSVAVMLERVADSDAHFKQQQRGEPDLTTAEKHAIAMDIFQRNPAIFLSRFGRYLIKDDLTIFQPLSKDYEVGFHLKQISKHLNDRTDQLQKRNRRFEAMKRLISQGEYFDEESMKNRDPFLYEQMIGQYLTDEQVNVEVKGRDLSFSGVLLRHVQALQNNQLYQHLHDVEDGQMEEEEDSEGDENDIETKSTTEEGRPKISSQEQQMLRNEFLRTMQLRFLNGEDAEHFDYSEVDENADFDSLDIRAIDEQESYFDEDSDEDDVVTHVAVAQIPVNTEQNETDQDMCDISNLNQCSCSDENRSLKCKYCDRFSERKEHTSECVSTNVCSGDKTDMVSDEDLDYESYEVKEDVCPGLNPD